MKFSLNIPWTILFLAISILSLVLGVVNYFHEKTIFAAYEPATAIVTKWIPDPNYGTADFCPVYEFTTKEGESRSYTGEICESKPDPSTVGKQQEKIYYDPTNPYTSVETRGWLGSEGSGLILGAIGFVFFSLFWVIPLVIALFKFFFRQPAPAHVSLAQADYAKFDDKEAGGLRNQEIQVQAHERLDEARLALAKLEELKELRDSNIISEADFQKKKQEIASKLRR